MPGHPDRFLTICIILLISLVSPARASAQVSATSTLTAPDTANYPHLSAYLDVHDAAGQFVHGLANQDVTILEDGISLPVDDLEETAPGVQFVIAITPGASFAIRDADGVSRYELLSQGLLTSSWVSQTLGIDDYSLLTVDGPQLVHSSNPSSLASALWAYQPGEPDQSQGMEVLASALQVASDPTPRPGMERAILYITPPLEADNSMGLQSMIASARQQNIHIFVWLLAAPETLSLPAADQLKGLADQTTGSFFAFSHDEAVPDLETFLEPLRYVYTLGYNSQAITPGPHQVVAQVKNGTELTSSPPVSFDLDLMPPVISIMNPPLEIVRNFSNQPTQAEGGEAASLRPDQQVVSIQVAYPDGYNRAIALTRLYVDGTLVAENRSLPFNQLVWDLRPYTQDGTHTLQVEVIDSLGITSQSDKISANISVPSTTQGLLVEVSHKSPLLVGAVVLVGASLLVLAFILGGRIRPRPHLGQGSYPAAGRQATRLTGVRKAEKLNAASGAQALETDVTKQVRTPSIFNRFIQRLPWIKHEPALETASAYLVPLVGFDDPTLPALLQIKMNPVSLGSDAQRANLVIDDPSIESLHATINIVGATFMICDAGTIAGTWVNYEEVTSSGSPLHHMDIIHLGRIGFRFQLPEPGQLGKVIVSPLEPPQ